MASDKKLLLICPRFFGYEKEIVKQAAISGWDVTFIDTRPANSFFIKAMLRLGAEWIINRKIKKHHKYILSLLKKGNFSKALFINPEGFRESFFTETLHAAPKTERILYVWDSMLNKPLIKPLLGYFTKVYTFDREDAASFENMHFLPLFYTERYALSKNYIEEGAFDKSYDMSFIGTVHSQRMAIVEKISSDCIKLKLNFYRYLYIQSRIIFWFRKLTDIKYARYHIKDFNFVPLTQQQVTDIVMKSIAVLDIEHHKQKGLTMRTFEVLGSGRKLVTTNADIINYDIYHPQNVLIIDRKEPVVNPEFFSSPFYQYPDNTIEKYSLSNWLKVLLS
ncbi:hypothetical protein ACQK5W_12130 [Pantoea sp. FN060301]|uniref:hypothetical protein n=1 Tax=Pantoea sp. FN060301 TaxID=3420380 RepID=UPI003D1819F9